jgi:hypothetical protein
MTPFSASDAALEGFSLIRRRWRVVLGWAGFNLLALVMLVVVTVMVSFVAAALSGEAKGPTAAAAGLVAGLGGLFVQAALAAAVFRVELRPDEPAFMHLRLGPDELRLVAVWLITLTGAWVVGWAAAMLGHALGAGGVWIGLLALVLCVYLGLRFLLAAPVSFVERRIDFPRSWRLTRGRVLALLGMSALSFFLVALLMVTVFVVLGVIAVGFGGLEGLASVFGGGGAEALQRYPGLYVLEFAVEVVLTPVLWTLAMAPLAAAYQAFAAEPADGAPAAA